MYMYFSLTITVLYYFVPQDCTCTFPNVTSDIQLEPSLPQILPAVLNTSDKNSER